MKGRKLSTTRHPARARPRSRSAPCSPRPSRAAGAAAGSDHAAADRGREERRQGGALFLDGPAGRREARQGVRGDLSRHRRSRSSAPARSGCSSASPRNSASNIHAADVINTSDASHFIPWKKNGWLAPFVSEDIAKYFPAELSRSRRHVRDLADLSVVDRLQHQSGEARRRAEELCRPARSRNGPARWSRAIRPIAAPS